MSKHVTPRPDPLLVSTGAPGAAVVDGPCPEHGDVLVQYCEVFTQGLRPALVGVVQILVCMS